MSDLFDLSGKTAVVIGAASGIGEAIAAGFARQSARVVAFDINPDASRNIAPLDITTVRLWRRRSRRWTTRMAASTLPCACQR